MAGSSVYYLIYFFFVVYCLIFYFYFFLFAGLCCATEDFVDVSGGDATQLSDSHHQLPISGPVLELE